MQLHDRRRHLVKNRPGMCTGWPYSAPYRDRTPHFGILSDDVAVAATGWIGEYGSGETAEEAEETSARPFPFSADGCEEAKDDEAEGGV